jgi:hypothetical protein
LAAAAAAAVGARVSGGGSDDDSDGDTIGGYGPAAAHAAMRAALGLPPLPRAAEPLQSGSEEEARWLGLEGMALLLREAGCVQQHGPATLVRRGLGLHPLVSTDNAALLPIVQALWVVPACVPAAALLAAAQEIEGVADSLGE